MTGTPAAIELHDLHKRFGSQQVLCGLNLSVIEGETVVVLGRSGTGKSVTLRLIVGLEQPDAGSVKVHGQEITELKGDALNAARSKIGFLFQDAALYDSLTVAENVAFPIRHRSDVGKPEKHGRVQELLAFVGMEKDARKMPADISGGMKKRVGLARALALDPDILLFDEPTSALDPITAREIEDLILKLQKERHVTSLVVTHDIRGARHYANRMAFVDKGTIAAIGTLDELRANRHPFVTEFLREAL
jgi:phospholipid/cholesterol/gamma-HCH transport system ATP-binding protein